MTIGEGWNVFRSVHQGLCLSSQLCLHHYWPKQYPYCKLQCPYPLCGLAERLSSLINTHTYTVYKHCPNGKISSEKLLNCALWSLVQNCSATGVPTRGKVPPNQIAPDMPMTLMPPCWSCGPWGIKLPKCIYWCLFNNYIYVPQNMNTFSFSFVMHFLTNWNNCININAY